MIGWRDVARALVAVGAATVAGRAASGPRGAEAPDRGLGWSIPFGDGTVSSYARWQHDGAPQEIGARRADIPFK